MFCSISPLIFKLEKATIYQIKANVMRIQQNLTILLYLLQKASYSLGSQSTFIFITPYILKYLLDVTGGMIIRRGTFIQKNIVAVVSDNDFHEGIILGSLYWLCCNKFLVCSGDYKQLPCWENGLSHLKVASQNRRHSYTNLLF